MAGETPLGVASHHNRKEVVQLLLRKGAKINMGNKFGNTPLHWAAVLGHPAMVKLLLDGGAEVNQTTI